MRPGLQPLQRSGDHRRAGGMTSLLVWPPDVAVGGEAVVTLLDADDEWSAADALHDRCRAA